MYSADEDDHDSYTAPAPAPAPTPSENEARMQRLRTILADMRAEEEAEEQRLAAQIDQIVPNGSALAMEAASNPSVTRFNAKEWFRRKLPEWITADTVGSAIILALVSLFMIYSNWSFTDMGLGGLIPPPAPPPTWWDSLPSRSDVLEAMRRYPSLSSSTPCSGGSSSSVVDEVFAKHEAKAKTVARRPA